MKYSKQIILLIVLFSSIAFAQKKNFTMEDVVFNSTTTLAPTTLEALQWIPNEYSYSFVDKFNDIDASIFDFLDYGNKMGMYQDDCVVFSFVGDVLVISDPNIIYYT